MSELTARISKNGRLAIPAAYRRAMGVKPGQVGRQPMSVVGGCVVTETEEFLALMLPRLKAADTALHNGDPVPRKALWSTKDPVTLFGAVMTSTGWPKIDAAFDWLASRFSNCESFEIEVISAGASGDLAYIAAYEHTKASIGGDPPSPHSLRVTTIFGERTVNGRSSTATVIRCRTALPHETAWPRFAPLTQNSYPAGRDTG